jgi:3-deoxy-manno-octulosonate cytidylyltransferase (CMP-KDO synthetase)
MKTLGIIPARYASTRFPGKPLALIGEKTMIRRVWEQARKCRDLSRVVVATDDARIEEHVLHFGGEAMTTAASHASGTERCQEVSAHLVKEGFDVVINLQGDEPFIHPEQISQVISLFRKKEAMIGTLAKAIRTLEELLDPNVVKVVFDRNERALLFSRQAIPYCRNIPPEEWISSRTFYRHIGIYGYRPEILMEITALPVSGLEEAESLEQLRWIENGFPIHVGITSLESISIDTPADLLKITNIPRT